MLDCLIISKITKHVYLILGPKRKEDMAKSATITQGIFDTFDDVFPIIVCFKGTFYCIIKKAQNHTRLHAVT